VKVAVRPASSMTIAPAHWAPSTPSGALAVVPPTEHLVRDRQDLARPHVPDGQEPSDEGRRRPAQGTDGLRAPSSRSRRSAELVQSRLALRNRASMTRFEGPGSGCGWGVGCGSGCTASLAPSQPLSAMRTEANIAAVPSRVELGMVRPLGSVLTSRPSRSSVDVHDRISGADDRQAGKRRRPLSSSMTTPPGIAPTDSSSCNRPRSPHHPITSCDTDRISWLRASQTTESRCEIGRVLRK
jgi:hypothetical protein